MAEAGAGLERDKYVCEMEKRQTNHYTNVKRRQNAGYLNEKNLCHDATKECVSVNSLKGASLPPTTKLIKNSLFLVAVCNGCPLLLAYTNPHFFSYKLSHVNM